MKFSENYQETRILKLAQSKKVDDELVGFLISGKNRLVAKVHNKGTASAGEYWNCKVTVGAGNTAKCELLEKVEITSRLYHFGGGTWGMEIINSISGESKMKIPFPSGNYLSDFAMSTVAIQLKHSDIRIFSKKIRHLYRNNFESYVNRMKVANEIVNRVVSEFMGSSVGEEFTEEVTDVIDEVNSECWKYIYLPELPCKEPDKTSFVIEVTSAIREDLKLHKASVEEQAKNEELCQKQMA